MRGFKRRLQHAPQTILCDFAPLREIGPRLWPEPRPDCSTLAPLPKELESLPSELECSVTRGVIRAYRNAPPIVAAQAPNTKAPFRSRPLNTTINLIVGSTDAITQNTMNTIYVALRGAASLPVLAVLAKPPVLVVAPVEFYSVTPPDYQRAHIGGLKLIPDSLDAYNFLRFTVTVGGVTVLDQVGIDALEKFSIDASPRKKISFQVANLDPLSAFLVYFNVTDGWMYPSQGQGPYLSDAVIKNDGSWIEPTPSCAPNDNPANNGGCLS